MLCLSHFATERVFTVFSDFTFSAFFLTFLGIVEQGAVFEHGSLSEK